MYSHLDLEVEVSMAYSCAREFATFAMEETPEEADGVCGHPEIFPAKTCWI